MHVVMIHRNFHSEIEGPAISHHSLHSGIDSLSLGIIDPDVASQYAGRFWDQEKFVSVATSTLQSGCPSIEDYSITRFIINVARPLTLTLTHTLTLLS